MEIRLIICRMIGSGTGRTSRSTISSVILYVVVAFLLLTYIFFSLERARKQQNGILWMPQNKSYANSECMKPAPSPTRTSESRNGLARALDAQIILKRNLTRDQTTIPRIFHQSWVDHDLPKKFEEWSRSCRKMHPDWEWVLWTNEDNHDLVKKYAPWFLETYEALESEILRADSVRNIYMHVFGG